MSSAFSFTTSSSASSPDPFAPPAVHVDLRIDDPQWQSRPTPDDHWLELSVRFGASVLLSKLCSPHADVVLVPQGDDPIALAVSKDGSDVEVALPGELLGASSVQLVSGKRGHTRLIVPAGASGTYRERQRGGVVTRPLVDLEGRAASGTGDDGSRELPLLPDATFELETFGLVISVGLVRREKTAFRGLAFDRGFAAYLALSLSTFGGLLAGLAYFTPPLGLEDESGIDKERLLLVQHYMSALAQREQELEQTRASEEDAAAGGEASAPAPGKPGEAGKPEAERKAARIAIKGPKDQPNVELSSQELRTLAQNFGLIGLLKSDAAADPDAPFSAFARGMAVGHDDLSARGNLWGMDIGEAAGQNGLYLSGTGFGGLDGDGTGVGIEGISSSLGTLGKCTPGAGKVCGFGEHVGRTGGAHPAKAPRIRTAEPTVGGRLPPEVVQRIVRQNFGRFRFCYERGLAQNPSLEGRVAVRFVIDRSGAVSTAAAEPGGMPDPSVASCVAQGFLGLSFPPPEGGIVTVSYPIMFAPQ